LFLLWEFQLVCGNCFQLCEINHHALYQMLFAVINEYYGFLVVFLDK